MPSCLASGTRGRTICIPEVLGHLTHPGLLLQHTELLSGGRLNAHACSFTGGHLLVLVLLTTFATFHA